MNRILLPVKLELKIYSIYPRENHEGQAFIAAVLGEVMGVKKTLAVKVALLNGSSEHHISSSGLSLLCQT